MYRKDCEILALLTAIAAGHLLNTAFDTAEIISLAQYWEGFSHSYFVLIVRAPLSILLVLYR